MAMVSVPWLCKGSRGRWICGFLVSPVSGFEPTSKKTKHPEKAITRVSDFSVARECKHPTKKWKGQERGGALGPLGPPSLFLSFFFSLFFPLSFWLFSNYLGSLHSLATEKLEIRVTALSEFCVWFEVGSKPETGENENNGNRRIRKPRFLNRRRNRLEPNRTGAFLL